LTPAEELRLRVAAQQRGIAPAELVRKLLTEHLPPAHDENAAAIALLQSWLEEDMMDDPAEIRQAQGELERVGHRKGLAQLDAFNAARADRYLCEFARFLSMFRERLSLGRRSPSSR